jgi:uncharacterized protein YjbJ (UPF0337 family)
MLVKEELKGRWDEIKGKLQERWGALTDNDLHKFNGNVNQLVGVIERRTGESRRVIEDFLEQFADAGLSTLDQASEAVQEMAGKAKEKIGQFSEATMETVRGGYDRVAGQVQAGYEGAADQVRRHPMESVAVSFGAGLIAGVVVSLMLQRR